MSAIVFVSAENIVATDIAYIAKIDIVVLEKFVQTLYLTNLLVCVRIVLLGKYFIN